MKYLICIIIVLLILAISCKEKPQELEKNYIKSQSSTKEKRKTPKTLIDPISYDPGPPNGNELEQGVVNLLSVTPPDRALYTVGLVIEFHSFGDKWLKYTSDGEMLPFTSDYKYYWIDIDMPNPDGDWDKDPLIIYLGMREQDKRYCIELTPKEQRVIIQKMVDGGIFKLDNPLSGDTIAYYTSGPDEFPDFPLPYKDYINKTFNTIGTSGFCVTDETLRNKTVIDNYIQWFEDKYRARLLANPAPNNEFPFL